MLTITAPLDWLVPDKFQEACQFGEAAPKKLSVFHIMLKLKDKKLLSSDHSKVAGQAYE
ncbi:hypothetical protein [Ensifer sp. BR816]|uniref:hypothetical protein n=1 Tax=Rhizobium sp. (strain BR816) TaxID=1057002 RepID=UPI0012F73F31|nr:hypothetical protein [Ensifer sp. BR816]